MVHFSGTHVMILKIFLPKKLAKKSRFSFKAKQNYAKI
jgi:hypothetical protein